MNGRLAATWKQCANASEKPKMTEQQAHSCIMSAHKLRQLTGKTDADVSFFITGKWIESGRKRLDGRAGPVRYCAAEFEDSVQKIILT